MKYYLQDNDTKHKPVLIKTALLKKKSTTLAIAHVVFSAQHIL